MASTSSDEEILAEADEPPDLQNTPRPFASRIPTSTFSKTTPPPNQRKESLLTSALNSAQSPVVEDAPETTFSRGLSSASTWSDRSAASTAELTSDGGCTSPGTRTSTPSPPLPSGSFHRMGPVFKQKPFEQHVSIVRHDEEHIGPLQKPISALTENLVEANLGRKRCITFACGRKDTPKVQPTPAPVQAAPEAPKRVCTIKFACPSKVFTQAPTNSPKPRTRHVSPAPMPRRLKESPKTTSPKSHRDSDSTVRNESPRSLRKPHLASRQRKLSLNSDLAKSEAFRFHEFASSEDEADEWTQESTCHRTRLTVHDTLKVENTLRQLGEEIEEEVLEDEDEEDMQDDEDGDNDDDDEEEGASYDSVSDDGFHSDDEKGYGSGEESDNGSDYRWWAPGQSTAATSMDHIEHIRPVGHRTVSESSIGSIDSASSSEKQTAVTKPSKRRKSSHPLAIRAPSPELPDSTDFVCGTLDEDRPLEDAYMSCLERRRAAKHKACPQDIDPTFPQSDPEMEEEDENEELEEAEDESDQHLMVHGQMDAEEENELRGRRKTQPKKRSPAQSPKRLRSPPPMKRCRSPPPRKLFNHSPKRLRSPPAPLRLRSPPPTRRTSLITSPNRMAVRFTGLAERPPITESSSLPRTPATAKPPQLFDDDEDNTNEFPTRGAIDIKLGLERKRLRRREKLYQKLHRKTIKEKEKRPAPGRGAERMREMGMGLAAKGRKNSFPARPQADGDVHMLSV
ncbi:uncharacterized protein BDZ99DRAFT_514946 [Mytilinidion resinicola]|uniref:Extensin domain-containing protein n=1 Tax=Mytilinidion resinicola TaxID=574789 RepID=A0A6A6Z7V4_9PEZI|nr:uncharacterized protein BDZ99DRAFT_514946 [Mytilinidion resinicola]KAF2816355.1 hypothetical protein BDZ99DRAFT_514946 [Mytilinidion resinicola]